MDVEGKLVNLTETVGLEQGDLDDAQAALQLFWLLLSAQIVFFMQAGFAMLEVGLVGHKNAKSILFKNMLDMCVGTITWWLWGFGIAGPGASCQGCESGKNHNFGIQDWEIHMDDGSPFLHSLAFAATTCTIMSGGVAERMKLSAYLLLAVFLISIVYPVVIGQGWDSAGYLCKNGFVDFAGSCLVHLCGGVAALLGAILIGPRKHRFESDGSVGKFKENSVLLAVLGAMILVFCWISFNASSTLVSDGANMLLSVHSVVNTILALSSASASTVIYDWVFNDGVNDIPETVNGLLGGLVAITAGCAFVDNWAALLIGVLSSFVTKASSNFMLKCKIDDPLDAFTVHGSNGIMGTILLGVFGKPELLAQHYAAPLHKDGHWGIVYPGSSGSLLGIQVVGVLFVIFFTAIAMFLWTVISVGIISMTKRENVDETDHGSQASGLFGWIQKHMRMSSDVELVGADYIHHGGSAFELTALQIKLHNEMRSAQDRLDKRNKKRAQLKIEKKESSRLKSSGSSISPNEEKGETIKTRSFKNDKKIKGMSITGEGPPMGSSTPESETRSRENSSDTFKSVSTPVSNPDEEVYEVE